MSDKYKVKTCRICKGNNLHNFLSLGSMPIPNGFLTKKDLLKPEKTYPLEVIICQTCWLMQLSHVVPARLMFKNYLYIPSTSISMIRHFQLLTKEIIQTYQLKSQDLVIDIGSNDGTLLEFFKQQEINVLGVDPAKNLSQLSNLKGIETINDYFTEKVAKNIVSTKGKAKVIIATNVVGHINDLHNFFRAINILLDTKGVFITEFPYLPDLISRNEFDTIYHEHLSYFSLNPLMVLYQKHAMKIINIKRLNIHGGSIRVYLAKSKSNFKQSKIINDFIEYESIKKLNRTTSYSSFAQRVKKIKENLNELLNKLKKQHKIIIGYGASAKGNVLLNYCGIGPDIINYIVDSIFYKQGRYTPGTHIPIFPESRLEKDQPDYALLFSWNFKDEIIKKQVNFRKKGGKFIITTPHLKIF